MEGNWVLITSWAVGAVGGCLQMVALDPKSIFLLTCLIGQILYL